MEPQVILSYVGEGVVMEWTYEPRHGSAPYVVRVWNGNGALRAIAHFADMLGAEDYITDTVGI